MPEAICNTAFLLYLYRISAIGWLPRLFTEIWTLTAVLEELRDGRHRGYDVREPNNHGWLKIVDPRATPSKWLSLNSWSGELASWR
jgi:hypothetical protein